MDTRQNPAPFRNAVQAFCASPHVLAVIGIALIGFLAYSNSLNNNFMWDDYFLVRNNAHIKQWSYIGRIFIEDVGTGSGIKIGFWRPLQMLTYMCNYACAGLNLRTYHLTNIVLHILVALALYWCIVRLFANKLIAFVAALLFSVHPVHTEAVTYISGRSDSLAALCILLSFIAYLRYLQSRRGTMYTFMLISFSLALLSREISIFFPLSLLLYHYAFKIPCRAKTLILPFVLSVGYIVARLTLLKSFLPETATSTVLERLPGAFVALANYSRLLCMPSDLHMEYGNRFFGWHSTGTLIGVFLFVAVIGLLYRKRNSDRLLFFSFGWFLLWLLPSLNIFPINAYMAEHWLYLPSMGIFIILANVFYKAYTAARTRAAAIICVIILIVTYAFLTLQQNEYWKHPIAFYERTIRYNPFSARLYGNLGSTYRELGKFEEAVAAYQKALEVNPSFTGVYINMGIAYEQMGNYGEAIKAYEKAALSHPEDAAAYAKLAQAYYTANNPKVACRYYQKAVLLGHTFAPSFSGTLQTYCKSGRP